MISNVERNRQVNLLFGSSEAIYRHWRTYFFKKLSDGGISPVQMVILIQLNIQGRHSGRSLCESLGMSPSALSQQLDTLDKLGYLTRERDTQDRRVTYFGLTEAGVERAETLDEKRRAYVADISAGLTDSEIERMVELQQKLLSYIESRN